MDQFDSRKHSIDSQIGGVKGSPNAPLNTRKIDTTSSYKSGEESAPEPPQPEVPSGLARVTSYNKL